MRRVVYVSSRAIPKVPCITRDGTGGHVAAGANEAAGRDITLVGEARGRCRVVRGNRGDRDGAGFCMAQTRSIVDSQADAEVPGSFVLVRRGSCVRVRSAIAIEIPAPLG